MKFVIPVSGSVACFIISYFAFHSDEIGTGWLFLLTGLLIVVLGLVSGGGGRGRREFKRGDSPLFYNKFPLSFQKDKIGTKYCSLPCISVPPSSVDYTTMIDGVKVGVARGVDKRLVGCIQYG